MTDAELEKNKKSVEALKRMTELVKERPVRSPGTTEVGMSVAVERLNRVITDLRHEISILWGQNDQLVDENVALEAKLKQLEKERR